ncbi:MAG: cytochrome c [Tenuifilaceae bacterium]|jgi:mono/diheme cytochrome c family protein|nr:cytochrome c [Tenuifilaceae bacterium]
MKTQMKFLRLLTLAVTPMFIMAFMSAQDLKIGAPWDIPAKYKEMNNPYKGDASLDRIGKITYNRHCKSCHGNVGHGDGVMTKTLKTFPGDLSNAEFHKYTDGEIYFMSIIGRDEMPNYEKLIPSEEDRWAVVNYIRSLKKN